MSSNSLEQPIPTTPPAAVPRVRPRSLWALAAILIVHLALLIVFSRAIPALESPGEAEIMVELGLALPPASGSQPAEAIASSMTPPPLYRWIASSILSVYGGPLTQLETPPNAYARVFNLSFGENQNAYLPTPASSGPLGPTGVLLALRLFSWMCSLATVLATFALGRAMSPRYPAIALGGAGLVALNPSFCALGAASGREPLGIALTTLALLGCVQIATGSGLTVRIATWLARSVRLEKAAMAPLVWSALIVGLLCAAAALVLPTSLVLLPVLIIAPLQSARGTDPSRRCHGRRASLVAMAAVLLLAGWWYVATYRQSGMGIAHSGLLPLGITWSAIFPTLYKQWLLPYWGLFGWGNIALPDWIGSGLALVTLAALTGLLLLASRIHWKAGRLRRYVGHAALLATIAALLLAAWLWLLPASTPWQPGHKLLLFVAPISLLLCTGLAAWIESRRLAWLMSPLLAALLALCILSPTRIIAPVYAAPPPYSLDTLTPEFDTVQVAFADDVVLLGYSLSTNDAQPGGHLDVSLYWLARRRLEQDYAVEVVLRDHSQSKLGSRRSHPAGGRYPTSLWIPGQVVADTVRVPISSQCDSPLAAEVRVSLIAEDQHLIEASDLAGNSLPSSLLLGRARIADHAPPVVNPTTSMEAMFGERIRLLGYDLPKSVHPGQSLNLTLYWESIMPTPWDYTVFVHLLDAQGAIVSQVDEQPRQYDYPTSYWLPGDHVTDRHTLSTPQNLEPGEYSLAVGLYRLGDQTRLECIANNNVADHCVIRPVTIAPQPEG